MATSSEGDGSRNAPTGEMLSPANKKPCRACTDFKSFTASKGFGFKKKTTDDVSFVLFSNAKCRNIIHVLHQLITATGSFSLKMMATPSPVHGPATVDRLPTTMWACVQHMYAMFTHAENNGMIPVGIIRSRTRQNFELVHIVGPVQNFGPPARNFGPLRAEFAWREWRKTLGGHVANWAGLSGFSPRENKISHTFFIDCINEYSRVSNAHNSDDCHGVFNGGMLNKGWSFSRSHFDCLGLMHFFHG